MNMNGMKPRVENGRVVHDKVNTAKPRNPLKYAKSIAGTEEHLTKHPGDSIARRRIETFKSRMK